MANLSRSAGGFFAFHLFTYIAYLSMQGFFRTLGLLCTNFDSAFRVATFFVPNMISYAGYIIPVFDMKRWLFWISYINPLYYAFSGCMENEFMRISVRFFFVYPRFAAHCVISSLVTVITLCHAILQA